MRNPNTGSGKLLIPLILVIISGCSHFEAPRPGESELVKWIEWTHEVCQAITEENDET